MAIVTSSSTSSIAILPPSSPIAIHCTIATPIAINMRCLLLFYCYSPASSLSGSHSCPTIKLTHACPTHSLMPHYQTHSLMPPQSNSLTHATIKRPLHKHMQKNNRWNWRASTQGSSRTLNGCATNCHVSLLNLPRRKYIYIYTLSMRAMLRRKA